MKLIGSIFTFPQEKDVSNDSVCFTHEILICIQDILN